MAMRLAESKLTAAEVEDDLQLRDAQLARACALAPAGNRGWSAEWIMLREILRKPREMGTICPSSARLGRLMASFVNREEEGTIVELGAGTGAVTAALIQRGVSPGRLIVIEKSELLAEHLSERFPKICVRHADAAEQPKPFNQAGTINTIVSCLPLRSLPAAQVAQIAETWAPLLAPGGRVS